MEAEAVLEELLALLEQNGVIIRTEPMGGSGGGLCTIKDKQVFFVDAESATADTAALCAQAVRETVDLENIYLKPQIRAFLENGG
ncbi:MAG TPA: hypothetical protein HPP87_08385 [Planctomycetes bacterium]|nr:hypothetical protein [Planctomycetota bacterium]HIJ71366.1 hypothetical protein [Planctomycetota bacterium]